MPILVDYNATCIANLMVQTKGRPKEIDTKLFRHMVLNSLRAVNKRFNKTHGQLIVCADSRSWRKDAFAYYKKNREKDRETTGVNWDEINGLLNTIADELAENLPYPVVKVNGAEADDIIATLSTSIQDKNIIVSGDKDFMQLQKYPHITQWSPRKAKLMKCPDPVAYLQEHILLGDNSDGIPNFLSDDDTFVTDGKRQRAVQKKKLKGWTENDPKDWATEQQLRNYNRNKILIDFECIPDTLRDEILDTYVCARDKADATGKSKLINYLMKNRCGQLLQKVSEF
jgi:hypothetical protein